MRNDRSMRRILLQGILFAGAFGQAFATDAAEVIGGWIVAPADYDQARIATLNKAIAANDFRDIRSLIVIRGGKLLIERYYNGADRDSTHNPRSVSKTFTGSILGIAIADGHIDSVDQRLSNFYNLEDYGNSQEKKGRVTLRQLITMTSGFDGFDFEADSIGNEENMYPQPDWVRWTLDLPMAADRNPGDEWRYFTAGIVVLGDILNTAVPGGLEAYAHDRLFAKLGISNYEWQHTPQRVANTAGGTQLTPLDFAKFGQLYLDGGRWDGETVIPADWVEASLSPDIQTTSPGDRYGYLWWHKSYEVDGATWRTSYCTGNGGNKIFVFEEQQVVVVITAAAYGRRYMHSQVDSMMTDYVLPAIGDAGRK